MFFNKLTDTGQNKTVIRMQEAEDKAQVLRQQFN
jgi:hypothetical protein